ncbi:ABC transporter substrate-binding protein [Lachnotalea sp. AF33-28]|uniref:ABC transporter substrate-binding protein n=1 Tax=Lachnotalea sp. AF33-28 TaxID=2292046 RepID=UPI000E4A6DA9|nr:extracellular solute-binding protein [Lachnotalea sp. AF33-28]RHP32838.1 extracellular solute-binding protein [Lachnotalea sp. AF33-28]
MKGSKSFKKWLALFMVVAMVCGLTACSSGSAGTTAAPENTTAAPTTTAAEKETTTAAPDASGDKMKVTVSVQAGTGVEEAWTAVAKAYMEKNPGVEVVIDLKPVDGYAEWVQKAFTTAGTETDIVNINLAGAVASGKSINWLEYMSNDSPYSDGTWQEQFNFEAQVRDLARNEMTSLSLDSVQVVWTYNKDIFEEVGVEPPKTWDEFITVCEKIQAAGYQPIAMAGDYNSFWSGAMGWLAQIYADQTTRSMIEVYKAQEGDFCYDPDVDGVWSYDPTDPYNDDSYKVNQNAVRVFKAVMDGTYTADTPGMRTVWTNMAKIFPQYAGGDSFFGTDNNGSVSLFYQGKAAMRPDTCGRLIQFKNDMEKLRSGGSVTGSDDAVIEGVKEFNIGTFNMPTMEGDGIEAPVRTIEVATGFLGAIKKDKAHDDQVADLLMYFSSEEGQSLFLSTGIENAMTVQGPSLVYNVKLPADIQASFDNLSFIGNCQKGNGQKLARGMSGSSGDIDASYRLFYDYTYKFLSGDIDIEAWVKEHCANIDQYKEEAMISSGISASDLEHPENQPTGQ